MDRIENEVFKLKKYIPNKLLSYGFKHIGDKYLFKTELLDRQFILKVEISEENDISTELTEKETGEPYTLHLTFAEGAFIGEVREAYKNALTNIADECFTHNVFRFEYSYKIINYIKAIYGDDVEYLWKKFPDNAVARRKDNKKWYLAILTVGKDKFGFETKEKVEVIDLRAKTEEIEVLTKDGNSCIYPAYHMNKKHWISIILDGSVDLGEIYNRIDESYKIAK